LGLSLAEILTQKGAHVSIVARNKKKLDEALDKLEVTILLIVMIPLANCRAATTCLPIPNTERVLASFEYSLWFH
jgi:NADP-dependent 3-hydroxy acid dehydrogenase YdfG